MHQLNTAHAQMYKLTYAMQANPKVCSIATEPLTLLLNDPIWPSPAVGASRVGSIADQVLLYDLPGCLLGWRQPLLSQSTSHVRVRTCLCMSRYPSCMLHVGVGVRLAARVAALPSMKSAGSGG
jgi:hypothetical protein